MQNISQPNKTTTKTQYVRLPRRLWPVGAWAGLLFAAEFICLFTALDLTSVARVSILFYSMPVWLAIFGMVGISRRAPN